MKLIKITLCEPKGKPSRFASVIEYRTERLKIRTHLSSMCMVLNYACEEHKKGKVKNMKNYDYEKFYNIAEYGNENWKGCFTPREVAQNAFDYLCEFNTSVENGEPTQIIQELYNLLVEDGSEECLDWAYFLTSEIGLLDMDYMDYLETDREVIEKFIEDAKEVKKVDDIPEMVGILYKHSNGDLGVWQLDLPETTIDKIENILDEYRHRGCSVRGTKSEIAKEFSNETVEDLSESYGVIDLLTAAIMRNNDLSYDEASEIALRLNSSDYIFDRLIDEFIEEEE